MWTRPATMQHFRQNGHMGRRKRATINWGTARYWAPSQVGNPQSGEGNNCTQSIGYYLTGTQYHVWSCMLHYTAVRIDSLTGVQHVRHMSKYVVLEVENGRCRRLDGMHQTKRFPSAFHHVESSHLRHAYSRHHNGPHAGLPQDNVGWVSISDCAELSRFDNRTMHISVMMKPRSSILCSFIDVSR